MKIIKKIFLIFVITLLILLSIFAIVGQKNISCEPLLVWGTEHQPETITNDLISKLGGLPKTDMDVGNALKLRDTGVPLPIYPVKAWRIKTSLATNNLNLDTIIDDDPTYHYQFDISVMYTDGDERTLQWKSWRYGIVVCPLIIPRGNGPHGKLKTVP